MKTKASEPDLYVGLDLHSSNVFCGIINGEGDRVYQKRLPNEISEIARVLKPYRKRIAGMAVESTYNWYWLVDGLEALGYPIRLANPAKMGAYGGMKRTDDQSDAFWIAELLRLNILPTAYIYPKAIRSLRDLLRRRSMLVAQRTQLLLSLQSMITRQNGKTPSGATLKTWTQEALNEALPDRHLFMAAKSQLDVIGSQSEQIKHIDKAVQQEVKLEGRYKRLLTVPGVAFVLGATIMLESGPMERFRSPGNYASYARTVESRRESNGKKKGENNRKNGNRYLAWAFVEAAQMAQRYYPEIQSWFDRKKAGTNRAVATKALACKLAKATYFVLKNEEDFDMKKMFG